MTRLKILRFMLAACCLAASAGASADEIEDYLRTGRPTTDLQIAAASGPQRLKAWAGPWQPMPLTKREVLLILKSAQAQKPDLPIWNPRMIQDASSTLRGQCPRPDDIAECADYTNARSARVILRVRLKVLTRGTIDDAYEALRAVNPIHYVVEKLLAAATGKEPVMGTPITPATALTQVVAYLVVLRGTKWAMDEVAALRAETRALRFPPLRKDLYPIATTPLAEGEAIADSNLIISLRMLERYEGVPADLVRVEFLKAKDLAPRFTPTSAMFEGGGRTSNPVTISAESSSADYRAVLAALEKGQVGVKKSGTDGGLDRRIVADAFFAKTDGGKTPIFLTGDEGIYKRLLTCRENDPIPDLGKLGGKITSLPRFKDGFEVALKGRRLWVIPVPSK